MQEKKVVSIEERIPKLKEARKKKANRRLVFYLTIFFLLILIIIYLQSPLSNVKHVAISGTELLKEKFVKDTSGITTKDNIWSIDFEEIEKKIKALPEVKNVSVTKKLPSTVKIEVEEFIRVGYVKKKESFYPVLENGQALTDKAIPVPKGDATILIGWNDSTYLTEMTKELRSLHSELAALISEIHWIPESSNPYKLRLYMVNGREVLTSIRNFSEKMRAYPSIAMQIEPDQEGYINLDLGAYFVPYDSDEKINEDKSADESTIEVEGESVNEGER